MNIFSIPLLSTNIFLPVLGAVLLFILQALKQKFSLIRAVTLVFSLLSFILAIYTAFVFDYEINEIQFAEKHTWFAEYQIGYELGVDAISLSFILLTAFLTVICVIASSKSVKTRVAEFMALMLLLQSLIIGVFAATDVVLFYIFFEAVLLPMFLIIGIWGGERRVYASFKFFIYTFFGSVLFLLAILYMVSYSGSANMSILSEMVSQYDVEVQKWLWLAFFVAFAIKVPMWPFHTWLPDAHVQAPTAGSVMLAGVLLKMGGYGFLRFSLPMLPQASIYFADMVMVLSIIAVIYTSLVALVQKDMKKMIAYSSIAHMGYVTAGLFSFNQQGIEGAIFTMLSHGLTSASLFLCVGILYERLHTKEINAYGGLATAMPCFSVLFMISVFSSIGLPTTAGFIGEFFVLFGSFQDSYWYGLLLSLGMVLGAAYMLLLCAKIIFGNLKGNSAILGDISLREAVVLMPIAILIVVFGIAPGLLLQKFAEPIQGIRSKIDFFREVSKVDEDNQNI